MKDGEVFGETSEGEAVHRLSISAGSLSANILTYGAILRDLRLEGHGAPLVLGFESLSGYVDSAIYAGAVVGRYANRIARGRFMIDGERFEVDRNDRGNTVHGGGLDKRVWRLVEHGADFVTLAIHDPDGAMGFPGALEITCTHRLKPPATLAVELMATSDSPTLCNPAHHSYFNLEDGGLSDIRDHRLTIAAQAYLPVDGEGIPTGVVQPVEGTPFDFVTPRSIRLGNHDDTRYDHNFCLAASRGPLRRAAWAQAPNSGLELEVWTTEPGLQFFTGHIRKSELPGLGGRPYGPFSGFCLEPQVWPDSPNRPYFPQAILRPGEEYRQVSEYRFRLGRDI
jgi:aldose 1-epimerase